MELEYNLSFFKKYGFIPLIKRKPSKLDMFWFILNLIPSVLTHLTHLIYLLSLNTITVMRFVESLVGFLMMTMTLFTKTYLCLKRNEFVDFLVLLDGKF